MSDLEAAWVTFRSDEHLASPDATAPVPSAGSPVAAEGEWHVAGSPAVDAPGG